jgi:homoprotocatechuate degradation regulator HpaR
VNYILPLQCQAQDGNLYNEGRDLPPDKNRGYSGEAAQGRERIPEIDLLPSSTRRSLPMALLRAREVIMAHFRPMLARHDITEQQWRVLRVLAEAGPLEATELANQASILPPSLTRIIKALEERKFITRSRVKGDGRRARLAISPAGLSLIEELAPERIAIYDAIEQRFGAEQHEELLDMLDGLIRSQGEGQS